MRDRSLLLLSLTLLLSTALEGGCAGRATGPIDRPGSALASADAQNHLGKALLVAESPPPDAESAWSQLFAAQGPECEALFYPGWAPARRMAAQALVWDRWSTRWPDLRTGLYRLENRFAPSVAQAATEFSQRIGVPLQAEVHLFLVPDERAGAARWVHGRALVGLNAGALASMPEAALERELLRQLGVLSGLRAGQQSHPETLARGLLLEALGSWVVRAVRPQALEQEVTGCTAGVLSEARGRLRATRSELLAQLDSADPAVLDRWLVGAGRDPVDAVAARIAAFGLLRTLVRDALPSEVLRLPFAQYRSRAQSFWAPTGDAPAGGALVQERSAAEAARVAAGGKTAQCVGAFPREGPARSLPLERGEWTLQGARLTGRLGAGGATLGLIADIKRADLDTLQSLAGFVAQFRKAKVDAVLVAGDVAESAAGIREALDVLAQTKVPVLVIPGNREGQARYRRALDYAMAKHANVIDMTRVRLVDTDRFAVVGLPGYYDPRFTHARDGCVYGPEDVAALEAIGKAAEGRPRILMAHSPPRASGEDAIDWADAGANVGDPALRELVRKGLFEAGVYANLHEAGGRAVRSDLKTRVRPGSWVPGLHLVTGSANAMPWPMLDGRVSRGMAGLLDIKGRKLRYRVLRRPRGR